jgi:hypothetical protein
VTVLALELLISIPSGVLPALTRRSVSKPLKPIALLCLARSTFWQVKYRS